MNSKEFILTMMKKYGLAYAETIQAKASNMTGMELYDEYAFIPSFYAACAKKNMLERKAGFVCRSPKGRVVSLIQPYDSEIYKEEPEALTAQWKFKWSKNPKHALEYVSIATSPYDTGDCAIDEGEVYRSKVDGNVWRPTEYPDGWEKVE